MTSVLITEFIKLLDENTSDELISKLFFQNASYKFEKPGEESLAGGIFVWVQKYFISQSNFRIQLVVDEGVDSYFELSINIWDKKNKLPRPISLRNILNGKKYEKVRYEILQGLSQIAPFLPRVNEYIDSLATSQWTPDNQTFVDFFMNLLPAVRLLDIEVIVPKSLQEILKPKPTVKVKTKRNKSYLGLADLFDFEWQVAIGDHVINEAEFKKLLNVSHGLIKYKSNYIYVNEGEIQKLYKHFSDSKALTSIQMLLAALSGEYEGSRIVMSEDAKKIMHEINQIKELECHQA